MKLIVGLGNPGKKYQETRHNLGLRVIDRMIREIPVSPRVYRKLLAFTFHWRAQEAILAKPTTYMNESGQAVKKLLSYFKIAVPDLWVIHDDVDLPLGKIKIQVGRGAAGHHGAESVIKEIKSQNFVRFRLGIGRPGEESVSQQSDKQIEKFVLSKFKKQEEAAAEEMIERTAELIVLALKKGIARAQALVFKGKAKKDQEKR